MYRLAATIEVAGEASLRSTQEFMITIAPRAVPNTMPVVMWGNALGQIDWLTELGFTHSLGVAVDYGKDLGIRRAHATGIPRWHRAI